MATVTGLTAERMLVIENETVVDGDVVAGELILVTRGGTQINAGQVQGAKGDPGATGPAGAPGTGLTVGAVCDFPKAPVPAGWLICDGSIYNIVDYPTLAAYLGTTFGGNGTTTFGVPNYKGCVRVPQDAAQTEFDTIGEKGGEKKHILTIAELATHNHADTLAAPAHTHSIAHVHGGVTTSATSGGLAAPPLGSQMPAGNTGPASPATSGGASATALSGAVSNNGSSAGHNNLQPYVVVVTAIKT
jgi:microcystin-dependent protein